MKSYETEPEITTNISDTEEETALVADPADSQEAVEVPDRMDILGYEGEEAIETPQRRSTFRFIPPTREQLLTGITFWGVILLGAVLRFWGLGDKPLHHDESLHAYFSLQLMHQMENWANCFNPQVSCYHYDPLLHGPFQFHFIALVYKISQLLGAYDHGVNTYTVRILAATLGTVIVGLPFFLRDYLGKIGAWIACFLIAVSPSLVYFSRFAREDIYMACFTLLMVVAIARYVRERKMRWLIIGAMAFAFSYATKEATFLSVAVFGSFIGGLIAWELGLKWKLRSDSPYLPRTAAPFTLLAYLIVGGIAAKFLFGWLKTMSIYITDPKNQVAADTFVQKLKDNTVAVVPWIGIFLGVFVLGILAREMFSSQVSPGGRRRLAARLDPRQQRFLDTILTMPWTHWFFALLCGWTVFLVLFTVLFTNIKGGIGDGIWQGLYYWLQQQQVARGNQPWYYYLLLIPLYEQIGVVFCFVGIIRCIVQPTRFRLFLVYWFIGNVVIYSWAAEKMPWLMIHLTMPMLLIASIGLEPVVVTLINLVKNWFVRPTPKQASISETGSNGHVVASLPQPRVGVFGGSTAIVGFTLAILLLLPTLHNMYEVTYIHPADGPHEMMVYVQTTPDVNTVMRKVDALDQKMYGGKHLLPIGLTQYATWPFAWYVRDYTNVCFNYPNGCPGWAKNIPVIITGGDDLYTYESQYGGSHGYLYQQYHMRTWWDEGYKPPPCVPTRANDCAGEATWGGVGLGLWLSYGDNPPPNAKFNPGLAAQHIWQWWWDRRAIGDTGGSYDMGLFIRSDLGVTP